MALATPAPAPSCRPSAQPQPPLLPLLFVTGASSGIGQALAWRFYQAGYRLALVARRTQAIAQWAEQHALDPARYAIYAADVTVPYSIIAAAHACIAAQGTPDAVRRSEDPLVRQFVNALPEGPVHFHYPAPSVAEDFASTGGRT